MALQELMRLPAVSQEVLGSFEQAFNAKRSEKDQRNLIRKLLFNSGEAALLSQHVSGEMAVDSSARQSHSLSSASHYARFHGISMVSFACASFMEHCS